MFNDLLPLRECGETVYFVRTDLVTENVTSLTVSAEEAKIVWVVNLLLFMKSHKRLTLLTMILGQERCSAERVFLRDGLPAWIRHVSSVM